MRAEGGRGLRLHPVLLRGVRLVPVRRVEDDRRKRARGFAAVTEPPSFS